MRTVTDAVVLMAGTGSRLRGSGEVVPKPLVPILGRPLISYIAESLEQAGVRTLHAIVGANGDKLVESLRPLLPPSLELNPIRNPYWQKQNGISVLCAAGHVTEPFLLTMGDHLFDPEILPLVLQKSAEADGLILAIDKKLATIFDIDDAMKVQTSGDRVVTLGKNIEVYDAIDTGVFLCPNDLFDYLRRAQTRSRESDCSLADGVRLMASDGKVRGSDIGGAWWQDVDTPAMLAHAEENLRRLRSKSATLG
jgi:1L-myo-inositol 1-phosphate cytidylyltransferase